MTQTKTVTYVGKPLKRVEDPRLIRGEATYVDFIKLPGTLHTAILRSTYAHAKITSIKTEAAKKLPGVVGVFTGADVNSKCGTIPCTESIPELKAPIQTLLAGDRVYFVGHPIAIVVATDDYIARDALDLIEVDYEPLPVVANMEKATESGSPLTHPELGTNIAYTWTLSHGDVDRALKKADRVIKQRIVHQRLTPMPMEPRGCIASYSVGDGTLTLWTSTQIPHLIRLLLPAMIGLSENKIRVIAPEVGGGFGAKLNLYPEEGLCSYLSIQLGVPVKWMETRRENAAVTIHGRDQIGDYEVAVKKDGTLLGLKAHFIADMGSYLQMGTPGIPTLTGLVLTGCYKIPDASVEVSGVYTNKMATDAYRGAGRPEAAFNIERLMDIISDELGIDPIKLRLKNLIKPSEFPYDTPTGLTYDSGNYPHALKTAMKLANWSELVQERERARKSGKLFGIGVSSYVEICAFGPSKSMPSGGWEWGSVRIDISGKVTVLTGATPHGQGQETSFAQIVADRLGVPIEDVLVLHGDTNISPYGRDTYGSRATVIGGSAIVMCTDRIIEAGKKLAAHLLGTNPKQIQFQNGEFFAKGKTKKRLTLKQLAFEAYSAKNLPAGFEPGLEASAFYEPTQYTFPFGAHIVAVEVDRDTGEIKIFKYTSVDDCGPRINPLLVEGQVQGGIAQSIGQALFEQTVYDADGQLLTGEFSEYAIPRASDIPQYTMGSTVTSSPTNPLGIKGVGEAGTIGATPAIVNAVMDALSPLGIRHIDMPLTPEKIWRAISGSAQARDNKTRPGRN